MTSQPLQNYNISKHINILLYHILCFVCRGFNHAIAVLHANGMHCKGDGKLCGVNVWPARSGNSDGFYLNINA
jgi:hypothetical protein